MTPGDAAGAIALLALEMVIPVPRDGARWSLGVTTALRRSKPEQPAFPPRPT
jgi:hypothetical protein